MCWPPRKRRGCGDGADGYADVAQPFVNRPRDAEARVRAERLDEFCGLRVRLELERLLGALRETVRRASPEVARVDVRAARHEDLNDFVQPAERGAVDRGEVGLVDRVDVGAGVEQRRRPLPRRSVERRPRCSPGWNVERPRPAATINGVVPSSVVSRGRRPPSSRSLMTSVLLSARAVLAAPVRRRRRSRRRCRWPRRPRPRGVWRRADRPCRTRTARTRPSWDSRCSS